MRPEIRSPENAAVRAARSGAIRAFCPLPKPCRGGEQSGESKFSRVRAIFSAVAAARTLPLRAARRVWKLPPRPGRRVCAAQPTATRRRHAELRRRSALLTGKPSLRCGGGALAALAWPAARVALVVSRLSPSWPRRVSVFSNRRAASPPR